MLHFKYAKTDLPTVNHQAPSESRIPGALKNQVRPSGLKTAPVKRPQAVGPLNMLARRYRLPGPRLPQVLRGRDLFADADLVIKTQPNRLALSRWAIIVPKRVQTKATTRNRLKRRLLAVIDPAKIIPGLDIVVLVRRAG